MNAGSFTVTIPIPPVGVSPNARLHWAAKARVVKSARREAWYWFQRMLPADWIRMPIAIEVNYHCPKSCAGYKPRDVQNAIAALKPTIDGMVDAGVIPDDSAAWLEWGRLTLDRAKNGYPPGVTITVRQKP